MAYYTQTRTDSLIERTLAWTAAAFHQAAESYAKHRVYQSTLEELRALSHRDLADLGIDRSMIRAVALEAAEDQHAR